MTEPASTQALAPPESLVIENFKKAKTDGTLGKKLAFLNDAGMRRFESTGYPHRVHEMFTFVNSKELTTAPFDYRCGPEKKPDAEVVRESVCSGCEESVIVIVDGAYNEEFSSVSALDGTVKVTPLEDADWARDSLMKSVEAEKDAFALINSAFTAGGVALEIAAGATVNSPIQILHLSTFFAGKRVQTAPRVAVKAGRKARAGLLVKYAAAPGGNGAQNHFINSVMDIEVEESAALNCTQLQLAPSENYLFTKTSVRVKKGGGFFLSNGSSGGRLVRHSYDVSLLEEGAELGLNAVSVLRGTEQAHYYARVRHEAVRCVSNQWFRTIVYGSARTSVNSTVKVMPGAQESRSTQMINNLLLSPDGRADSKPNLMIFADDVKCTHGATVTQLEAEKIFYLRTRGMKESQARSILTASFARSIIDTVYYPPAAMEIADALLGKLEKHADG